MDLKTLLGEDHRTVLRLDDTWAIEGAMQDDNTELIYLSVSDGRGCIHLGRTSDYLNVPDLLRDLVEELLPKLHTALLHIDGQPALWPEEWLDAYTTRNAADIPACGHPQHHAPPAGR